MFRVCAAALHKAAGKPIYDTSYYERLISLNALTLEHERIVSDVSLLHKCIYSKVDHCLEDFGIKLVANNKRSGIFRLTQHRLSSCISNALFQHRAICEWNALPKRISKSSPLGKFKKLLRVHLQNLYIA